MKVINSNDKHFEELCDILLAEGKLHPLDSTLSRSFYSHYWDEFEFKDLSFAVEIEDAYCVVFVSSKKKAHGGCELGCYGLPMYYVESQSMNCEKRERAEKEVRKQFLQILASEQPDRIIYQAARILETVSPLAVVLLENGGKPEISFTQIIDLSQPEVMLKRQVRKSFRHGISWGSKNLELLVLDHLNIKDEHMSAFRELHVNVAGRETRSPQTWAIQLDMVANKEAFVVFGYLDSELVTAALFQYNQTLCFYGVSASDRNLFDKPISHAVIWKAVVYAQELGVKLFELGEQLYPGQTKDGQPPSQKEMNIGKFKRGFGGETYGVTKIIWRSA